MTDDHAAQKEPDGMTDRHTDRCADTRSVHYMMMLLLRTMKTVISFVIVLFLSHFLITAPTEV